MEFNSRLLRKAEKHISRLQRNIYKALMDGNQSYGKKGKTNLFDYP